jgi:hypothetical protein
VQFDSFGYGSGDRNIAPPKLKSHRNTYTHDLPPIANVFEASEGIIYAPSPLPPINARSEPAKLLTAVLISAI